MDVVNGAPKMKAEGGLSLNGSAERLRTRAEWSGEDGSICGSMESEEADKNGCCGVRVTSESRGVLHALSSTGS